MSEHCCGHKHAEEAPASVEIPKDASEETFRISGMDCSEEVAAIERALKPLGGVFGVRANIVTSKVTIYHNGSVSAAALTKAVNSAGVKVETGGTEEKRGLSITSILVAVSGVFTGIGILLQWSGFKDSWEPNVAFLIAILAGGWLVVPKAVRALKTFTLDMNVLMVVAVVGAVAIGEHAEGAAVAFLFSLSELLESWSVGRARRAIRALMQLAPEIALVKRDGQVEEVPARDISVGETILVKSGQRVPLDGTVTSGASAIDQAPITGESMPVEKKARRWRLCRHHQWGGLS